MIHAPGMNSQKKGNVKGETKSLVGAGIECLKNATITSGFFGFFCFFLH